MRIKLFILAGILFLNSFYATAQSDAASCLTNQVDGYASVSGEGLSTTTGGAGGQVVQISSLQQFQEWVSFREDNSTPQVVYINGLIEQPGTSSLALTIKRGGNVSLIGNTVDAGFKNIGIRFWEYNNVIVRNLTIREVFYPNDGITIDECHHVWIDHCDLYSKNGDGIGVDTYDGLLDIKNGSHNVTISWNRFHSHKKVNLLGHTDNAGASAIDANIRVTFHHNYYYDNDGRNPSVRFGAVHLYSNYFKDIYDYGIALRQGAHGLIENNIYENTVEPITTNAFKGEGIACERNNIFLSSGPSSITRADCNWWNSTTLPYSYTPTPDNQLISLLTSQTGTCSSIITGLAEKKYSEEALNIYPNPFNDQFQIDAKEPVRRIEILNMYGTVVEEIASLPEGQQVFAGRGLEAGTYQVVVRYASDKVAAGRLVKIK